MIKIFQISLREFLTKKFILLSTLPLIVSVLILGGFLIFGGIEFFSMLNDGAKSGDFSFIDEAQYPLLTSILAFALTKWLIIAIFYMIGVFFVVIISVVIALIVAGFLTPIATNHLNKKYYHYDRLQGISFFKTSKLMMIILLKFCIFLLISIPFLFIPVINVIVVNIPFFYLYYKFMLLDVGSNSLNKNDFEILWLRDGGNEFKLSCLVFYIVSLVPLLGLFLQLFFVIFLSNLIYKKHN
ncbi:EI24 domain-containing protein [Campylobacter sp. RM12327]|uniref:EI24 domain-containing protein n=1 Tax=Campylobacter sputorum TaxID=206 RepID=UPI00053BFF8B|nr:MULTISPECIES: EI24 domain-containing protein [Campylobacter]ASM39839.1 putative membrane protein (EI24 domain) [Campylobacter sputorum]MBF6669211.1 EI24 domain-containing protein [Campylobacter sp. RM12327]MBF6674314.1 EI24 domain-containing protein [Campylobacter sp. RM13538]MBF6675355.1 EI24 domain-containing protein [Campylobacter sp. RM12321]MBF6676999.1 EI24 domain-containing protein [Campylobacter sp. RM11259]